MRATIRNTINVPMDLIKEHECLMKLASWSLDRFPLAKTRCYSAGSLCFLTTNSRMQFAVFTELQNSCIVYTFPQRRQEQSCLFQYYPTQRDTYLKLAPSVWKWRRKGNLFQNSLNKAIFKDVYHEVHQRLYNCEGYRGQQPQVILYFFDFWGSLIQTAYLTEPCYFHCPQTA
jgi:hypothetical protein